MNPLLSFLIYSYNQEQFIKEAIEGALSQTYNPLQIILSDDNSEDRTFEIMREMSEAYFGDKKIVLHQCRNNLGTRMHLNEAISLAEGEFIILAAGDDISIPERTQLVYNCYIESGKKTKAILSDYMVINNEGKKKNGSYIPSPPFSYSRFISNKWSSYGATQSIHKDVFDFFGPLSFGFYEDQIIAHRALLLGGVEYIPLKLVKHRRHESNVSHRNINNLKAFKRQEIFGDTDNIQANTEILTDYLCFKHITVEEIKKNDLKGIYRRINFANLSVDLYTHSIMRIIPFFFNCIFYGIPKNLYWPKIKTYIKVYVRTVLNTFWGLHVKNNGL